MGDLYFPCIKLPTRGMVYPQVLNKACELYMCNGCYLYLDLGKTAQ